MTSLITNLKLVIFKLGVGISAICLIILILTSIFLPYYAFSFESNQIKLSKKVDWLSNNPLISSLKNLIFGGGIKSSTSKDNSTQKPNNITSPSLVPTPTEIYNRTRNSVVSIQVMNQSNVFTGSGFVFDNAGHIITNRHVIAMAGPKNISVTFFDGNRSPASIVGSDHVSDLAVLTIDNYALSRERLFPIQIGTAKDLSIGEKVFAIGNHLDIAGTMTDGIISNLHQHYPFIADNGLPVRYLDHEVMITDTPITHGNSGGVLLNQYGQLIGVTEGGVPGTNLNAAIPVDTVNNVIPWLIRNSYYKYPWVGFKGFDVSPDIANLLRMSNANGCIVSSVQAGSPAILAGLQAGTGSNRIPNTPANSDADIIVGVDNNNIFDCGDFVRQIWSHNISDRVLLTVLNNNLMRNVTVTLGWSYQK